MSTTTDPSTTDPSTIDKQICELEIQRERALVDVKFKAESIHRSSGDVRKSNRHGFYWESSTEDCIAKLSPETAERLVPPYAEATQRVLLLDIQIEALEQVYRDNRWSRFFLVVSSDGHIHSSTRCSTCRYNTVFVWLPDLSGTDEATAVEQVGEILCSICFPSAPVEWTNGESHAARAEREKREAAKAEREAKRDAKRLISGSDEGIVVTRYGDSERIKTVAAAKSFLTDGYENVYGGGPWDGSRYLPSDRDAVASLLLGRPGVKETTVEEILAAAKKRASKRR